MAGLLVLPAAASAATYTVDTSTDSAALTACTAAANDCSLRGAVTNANNSLGVADEIVLASDANLTIPGSDENNNATDDIDVKSGSGALTVRGDTAGPPLRKITAPGTNFRAIDAFETLTLKDVEITGGKVTTTTFAQGGGIRALTAAGVLTLDNAFIHDNEVTPAATSSTALGGGVYFTGASISVINGTRISSNKAGVGVNTTNDDGGGIAIENADATIANSFIAQNRAGGEGTFPTEARGGGLFYRSQTAKQLTVTNTDIGGNRGCGLGSTANFCFGGGVYVDNLFNTNTEGPDVTITGGSIHDNRIGGGSGGSFGQGGGLYMTSPAAGSLTITGNATFGGNHAGGNDGATDPASNQGTGQGGGLSSDAATTVQNSVFAGNEAGVASSTAVSVSGFGAGLAFSENNSTPNPLTVTGSTFSGNVAGTNQGGGAGIDDSNGGPMQISASRFDSNSANGSGGAINRSRNAASPTPDSIAASTFTGNHGTLFGGALSSSSKSDTNIDRSTFDNNTVTGPSAFFGGAIFAETATGGPPATLRLTNSTVSGNTVGAATAPTGFIPEGGGIALGNNGINFESRFSTIADNTAFAGTSGGGRGGNVFLGGTNTVSATFTGTIVSGGTATGTGTAGPNCAFGFTPPTTVISNGGNIEGPTTNECGFNQTSDDPATNPALQPLADNGGPTETRAILLGSPALDNAPSALCSGISTDQRGPGFPRLQGPACDSGAFELAYRTLTVSVTGLGTVTGSGIDCPGDCTESRPNGTNLALTATPGTDASFLGWSGDCSGTGACNVALSGANKAVGADFTTPTPPAQQPPTTNPPPPGTSAPDLCAPLRKKLRKAKKAHKTAKVRKLKKKLRKLGC